jgi:uracil-DNA glycosylase family 4
MSVSRSNVYVDYVVKCYPGRSLDYRKKALRAEMTEQCMIYRVATLQQCKPKAVVAMGRFAIEALTGRSDKVKESEGTTWIPMEPAFREFVPHIWACYSPAYALQDMGESVGIFRVLWHAATEAGLEPKIDKTLKPFDYGT